jgi:class 3 adenylate cyclase
MKPDVRYTWNDGYALAYQVIGRRAEDLVYLPGFASNVDLMWDIPTYRTFLERLASFCRLITVDRRGVGCSDRLPPGVAPTLEEITGDVLAVMEAASSSSHATILAVQEAAFSALLLAATHPYRISRMILFSASPSWVRSDALPDEWSSEQWEATIRSAERLTSSRQFSDAYVRDTLPSIYDDETMVEAFDSLLMNTTGLGAAVAEMRMFAETDLRDVLPSINVPTLVLRREGDEPVPESSSRYLAEHIAGAEYVEIPGRDALPWAGDLEPVLEAIQRFMGVEHRPPVSDRRLASVLFTDIVDSSARASDLGDAAWSALVEEHHRTVRRLLVAHGGTEIDTAGDGFFATFEGPAKAIRCARATVEAIRDLGLEIRAGVHAGEVETIGGKPGGAAVVIGARIAAAAGPSEVMASQTVKDLTAGSGLVFEDAGEHELKGVPDRWRLYRVVG